MCPFSIHTAIECAPLTHWNRVTHICVNKLTTIVSDNGLLPGRHKAFVWTTAGILLIWHLGNFREILFDIHIFLFTKMQLKMSSGKWRPFWLGLNVWNAIEWKDQKQVIFQGHYSCHVRAVFCENNACLWTKTYVNITVLFLFAFEIVLGLLCRIVKLHDMFVE